tara:strand:+ start:20371 stop:20553 length:183 start_codon:yes stop_codon:yes gene_type:complete
MEILTIMKNPVANNYIAHFTGDDNNEAHDLAHDGGIKDAIDAALEVWGLCEFEVHIKASN